MENVAKQEHEKETFKREELPGKFIARKLFGWSDKRYNQEYQGRLERNWRRQKGKRSEERKMETIVEEEEIREENSGVKEQIEENGQHNGPMLQVVGNSSEQGNLRGGWCHNLAKQLSYYLYFFSFSWTYNTEGSVGRCHITSVTQSQSHDGSYDKHGKVVHRPCSSCISSVENLMGTLLSSPC